MSEWWNRQTRRTQNPVPQGVEVQLLSRTLLVNDYANQANLVKAQV